MNPNPVRIQRAPYTRNMPRLLTELPAWWVAFVFTSFGLLNSGVCLAQQSTQPEVKVWEFAPYEVEIWYSIDRDVPLTPSAKKVFLQQLDAALHRTFRAAWRTRFVPLSSDHAFAVKNHFNTFVVDDLTSNELVLVVSNENETAKPIRTLAAALDNLEQILVSQATYDRVLNSIEQGGFQEDETLQTLVSKFSIVDAGDEAISEQLVAASSPCGLIPRSMMKGIAEHVRPIVTSIPWQSERLFRDLDKLFFVNVGVKNGELFVQSRELDCPMRYLGTSFEASIANWHHAPRIAAHVIARSFAPIARVEDASSRDAQLRMRAGGLIISDDNPALIRVGDLMQPIVRRDDRNGIPTLLQPLSWTFAAITNSDGVKLDANVYTYSGGPGLQGRKNRRTRRVVLRVRPKYDKTDIKIAVRGSDTPQSGCFVYRRDLITDKFEFLGRTDWRGHFTIPTPEESGEFLPESVRRERFLARRAKLQEEEQAAAQQTDGESGGEENPETKTPEQDENTAEVVAEQQLEDPAEETIASGDPDAIPLNYPLTQIYIKSGDTVLAKLPMVPGLQTVEVAELPDDSKRLQVEAFVRGFQGEILDLIGRRNLLAARVKLNAEKAQETAEDPTPYIERATSALDELRGLKNYNEMALALERLEKDMLDEGGGESISLRAQNKIDRMFGVTREMLQKYLQDNLLQEAEANLQSIQKGGGQSPDSTAEETAA